MAVNYAKAEQLKQVIAKLEGKINTASGDLTALQVSDLTKHFGIKSVGLAKGQYGYYLRMTTADNKSLNCSISKGVLEEIGEPDKDTIDTLFDSYTLWFGERIDKNADGSTRVTPWLSFGKAGGGDVEYIAVKTINAIAG